MHGGARSRTTALLGVVATLAHAQAPARAAHGLIIKLKEVPRAERPREAALAVGATQRSQLHRLMRRRRRRANLEHTRLRPFGPNAHSTSTSVACSAHEEAAATGEEIASRPDVEWVVPNTRERRLATPNDPFFATTPQQVGQWWLYPVSGSNSNCAARPAARRARRADGMGQDRDRRPGGGGRGARTGIVNGHPDFCSNPGPGCVADRLLSGYDFVADDGYSGDNQAGRDDDASDPGDWVSQADKSNDPGRFASCEIEPSSWHGTDISGLMVAATNNSNGVAAINWNGRVLPVRVAGKCGADPRDIVDGMRWAAGLQTCKVYDAGGNCTEPAPVNPVANRRACHQHQLRRYRRLRAVPGNDRRAGRDRRGCRRRGRQRTRWADPAGQMPRLDRRRRSQS